MKKLILVILLICLLVIPVAMSEEIKLLDDAEMDAGRIELEIDGISDESFVEEEISFELSDMQLVESMETEAEYSLISQNAAEVVIDENIFPNDAFRAYISRNVDTDGNGVLSEEEINVVREINVENERRIDSLKGIELFPMLTSLDCSGQNLTTLDVSHNTLLTNLDCSGNDLTDLNLSGNIVLSSLDCSSNELKSLDLQDNTSLIKLDCGTNELKALDLRNNTRLEYVECCHNYFIASLDVTYNPDLVHLCCESDGMRSLVLGDNENLEHLSCGNNELMELDLSHCRFLDSINYAQNYIGKLDITGCHRLISKIESNQLGTDDDGALCYFDSNRNFVLGPIDRYTPIIADGEELYKGKANPYLLDNSDCAVGMKRNIFWNKDMWWGPTSVGFEVSECSFKSSNTSVISVTDEGVISCKKQGKAKVTMTASNGYRAVAEIKVKAAPWKVTLDRKKGTLEIGETGQLKATIPKHTLTELKWSSSNKAVATVSSSGLVTAVGLGTTTITVKTHNGKKATCKVTVIDPTIPTKVKLNKSGTVKLKKGKTLQLKATVSPSTAQTTLTWKSGNKKVATVTQDGLVEAKKKGTTTITVVTGNGKTAKVKIKVV